MTIDAVKLGSSNTDDHIDIEIAKCLDPKLPNSFFLYAGAGSGKTRSLDTALRAFRKKHGSIFRKTGRKIAVITYTNAACDEISSRVGKDSLFVISTIHSFCWSQICSFHVDIRTYLRNEIPREIEELEIAQAKGRAGKASLDRERGIEVRRKRLEWLSRPRRFTYSPNGDNFGAASLNHSEVLKITAEFIKTMPAMQAIIINQYPFLLIDESQDTNKTLIDAFFALEVAQRGKFALGLFGDMMQRIYADGKPNLEGNIPESWKKPVKQMNHRSPQRIVQLGNALRSSVDNQLQIAREDSELGFARLFIAAANTPDKPKVEQIVRERMVEITGDNGWVGAGPCVKSLTLEHHMAASRMGFADLFAALDKDRKLTTGLRNGDLAGLRLFSERVAPLIEACSQNDEFATMAILRNESPLLTREVLKASKDPTKSLEKIQRGVEELLKLDVADPGTTFLDVLNCISDHNMFDIPNSLQPFVGNSVASEDLEPDSEEASETSLSSLESWRTFLETPYNQITPYVAYITDKAEFGTHQGVKGLEFDRVLVVIDDHDARGFMFSYEKLLGAKPLSPRDAKSIGEGKEIGVDRTRRLLYVTCTRAEKSLALVAYTDNPDQLRDAVIEKGWFELAEIECV